MYNNKTKEYTHREGQKKTKRETSLTQKPSSKELLNRKDKHLLFLASLFNYQQKKAKNELTREGFIFNGPNLEKA